MRKYLSFFLLSCCCFACQHSAENTTKKVFRFNQHNAITSLDPAFCRSQANIWVVNQLYNSLVQLDDSLNTKPCLATHWTISDDGLTYTFFLRNDVFFHDDEAFLNKKGRKLLASDVVYSFNRLMDDAVASPGSWVFKGKMATDNPFEATNDRTVVLHLNKPFRPMLGILSMQYCSVVPKEAVEKYGKDFRAHPVGTGAFQFKKWLEGQGVFLTKNEHYFEKNSDGTPLPYLDGVKVSCINERKTAFLELLIQKLDYLFGLESSYVNELVTSNGELQPAQREKLNFIKNPYLNTEYLGINLQYEKATPLKNKKIRQALNYAINRREMLRALRNNVGKPAFSGFTPVGLPSFDAEVVKGYNYNPDKARSLLAEAGFPEGKGLSEITLNTSQDYLDLCTYLARQWEEVGINVKIEILEAATLREMMTKGQAAFFRASWIADYADAENFLGVFYSKNPTPPNYTRFSNATYDQLYEAALGENDDTKRYTLYHEMEKILVEEAPVVFLFYDEVASFTPKNISGLGKNAINLLTLKYVKKE